MVLVAGFCLQAIAIAPAFAQPTTEQPVEVQPNTSNEPAGETNSRKPNDKKRVKSVIPTNLTEALAALKWWGLPFGIATFLSIWFSTEKLVVLRRARVIPKPFVERFLHHLREGSIDPEEANQLCEDNGSPVASIFAHGVRKWGKPSVEVEQAIIDGGERQVSEMRKHLRVINGVATVSPLIGLLGTVWGMIEAFNGIASSQAMGKPEELAAGIALALLTTAAGMVIAIPSLIMYMYLTGRVDILVMDMDKLAQEVVYSISAEALHERSRTQAGQ
ncbi:MAG: MotA/TolQ/ExbB proton channel family protein [Planctomycetaceae bacterium]|nr:MotA/TolQ/ExbB proton channel family protein [Planctomycetaceae bacterium]